jgi:hypothetical protein
VIWWQHVLALAGGLALIGFLVFNYRRLPAIWRGDQAPTLRNPLFTVYPRSYVSYMCFLTAFVGGFALLLIAGGIFGVASWARVLFNVSQWVMLAAVPILVGHLGRQRVEPAPSAGAARVSRLAGHDCSAPFGA